MEAKLKSTYKIALVGGEELALGFQTAGVRDTFVSEGGADSETAIRELLKRDDIGLIVITTAVTRGIKDRKILNAIDTSLMPMFIEVPEYKEEFRQDMLRKLILRAIGIDISKMKGS